MLPHHATALVRQRLKDYPAVALVGPRQCGKTTLAQALGGQYFDLEQEAERLRLDVSFDEVSSGRRLVILDEAQTWPELFARLRGAIDGDRKRMGRFLLLGSVSPALMTQVSESLAGRLSLVELSPLLLTELRTAASRRRHWLCGGFPDGGVLAPRAYPQWGLDYLAMLTQRDLPTWGLTAKPQTSDRLLRMLAALHGQTWNASDVGRSLGVSYHTVNEYVDYLVGAFLIRRLPSYQANVRKRLVKRPKIYWRDCGLMHALLRVDDEDTLLSQPWVGASFEGYVIEQAIAALHARGTRADPHFFRTTNGRELDLVLDFGSERWAVEVKLTSNPSPASMKRLDENADLIEASRRFLVCRIRSPIEGADRVVCDLETFLGHVVSR